MYRERMLEKLQEAKASVKKIEVYLPAKAETVHRYGRIYDKRAYIDIKKGLAEFGKIFNALEKAIG